MLRKYLCSLFILLSFAYADSNYFKIEPQQFEPDMVLEAGSEILQPDSTGQWISQKVQPLEAGYLYLRQKKSGSSYIWFKGKPHESAFTSLKAFLPSVGTSQDFIYQKLYGSQTDKAFQDEAEIYFDQNYIYSTRVSALYYIEKDEWKILNAVNASLGSIDIQAQDSTQIWFDGTLVSSNGNVRLNGIQKGIHHVKALAPGHLPLTSGVLCLAGQQTLKTITLPLQDTSVFDLPYPLNQDTILSIQELEVLEPYWDQLEKNRQAFKEYSIQKMKDFDSTYPQLMLSPAGLSPRDPGYNNYRESYLQTRDEALGLYLSKVLHGEKELSSMYQQVKNHKDSLEKQVVQKRVWIDAMQKDSASDRTLFKMIGNQRRIDVGWKGKIPDSILHNDTIMQTLRDRAGWWYFSLTLENNPVDIQNDSSIYPVRRHYRYLGAGLVGPSVQIPLQGEFVLPDYLLDFQEVIDWLQLQKPVVQAVDSVVQDSTPAANPWDEQVIWNELFRGEITAIPGGSFLYKGKQVEMSSFAMHRQEVNQALYQRITVRPQVSRYPGADLPMHSLNWHDARQFCQEIGGDLPTEAQWEYAARAGATQGYLWKTDNIPVLDFAVCKDKRIQGPQPVATRKPNLWGLYDVHGNVAEWTRDRQSWFSLFVANKDPQGSWLGSDRKFKGGSWQDEPDDLDLTDYDYEDPRYWSTKLGVRCVFPDDHLLDADSLQVLLTQKDSLARSRKIKLLGGDLKQAYDKLTQEWKSSTPAKPPETNKDLAKIPQKKEETAVETIETAPSP